MSQGAVRGTIRELDGLRGIAILLVLLHHFWPREGPWVEYAAIPHLGWIGVDLFFVVSGLLITGILLDTRDSPRFFTNFYARRSLRIFPLYFVFLLAAFTLIPAMQHGPWSETEFVRQSGSPWWYILYQGNLREAIRGVEPAYVIAPLWSLAIEEQFYLVFPLMVQRLRRVQLRRVLIGAIGGALLFRIVTALVWPENERIQYLATPARIDELAIGALMALGLRDGWLKTTQRRAVGGAAAILLLLGTVAFLLGGLDRTEWFGRTAGYSLVGFAFGAIVLWAVLGRETPSTSWLRWQPLRAVGKVCYGIYLLQRPVQVVTMKIASATGLPIDPEHLITVPILMLATFAVASVSWLLFERPILGLKRRFVTSGHPQEVMPGI